MIGRVIGVEPARGERQGAHVGAGRSLDDVCRDSPARRGLAVALNHHVNLAESILAGRHGVDAEVAQLDVNSGRGVDRVEYGVDGSVTGGCPFAASAVGHRHLGARARLLASLVDQFE